MSSPIHIVAVPIGNDDDFSTRAIAILQNADIIACEDTRHAQYFMQKLRLNAKLIAFHNFNEGAQAQKLLNMALEGQKIAIISDAGTPMVSDPGYRLAKLAYQQGVELIPVPGASAVLTALMVCGLPSDNFYFQGFLPEKTKDRQAIWNKLRQIESLCILFVPPHDLCDILQAIETEFGNITLFLGRELTKKYEEKMLLPASDMRALWQGRDKILGEFVVIIDKIPANDDKQLAIASELMHNYRQMGLTTKTAIARTQQLVDVPKNTLYKLFNQTD